MIRQNTAAIVVSDPAVLHTDLILLAVYPGIIMIITGDSNTNAIIAIIYTFVLAAASRFYSRSLYLTVAV